MSNQRWKQEFIKIGKLDQFQSFMNKEDGFIWQREIRKWKIKPLTKEEFIKNVLGIDIKYSYHLNAGTAVHQIIQKGDFLSRTMNRTEFIPVDMGERTWEISKSIDTSNIIIPTHDCEQWLNPITIHGIKICGKYDCKDENRIYDIKTSKNMDVAKFKNSFQWRFYLLMSGLNDFTYNLFTMQYDESQARDNDGMKKLNSNKLMITNYYQLDLTRENDLEKKCSDAVKSFSDFLEENKQLIKTIADKHGITLKYFEE